MAEKHPYELTMLSIGGRVIADRSQRLFLVWDLHGSAATRKFYDKISFEIRLSLRPR